MGSPQHQRLSGAECLLTQAVVQFQADDGDTDSDNEKDITSIGTQRLPSLRYWPQRLGNSGFNPATSGTLLALPKVRREDSALNVHRHVLASPGRFCLTHAYLVCDDMRQEDSRSTESAGTYQSCHSGISQHVIQAAQVAAAGAVGSRNSNSSGNAQEISSAPESNVHSACPAVIGTALANAVSRQLAAASLGWTHVMWCRLYIRQTITNNAFESELRSAFAARIAEESAPADCLQIVPALQIMHSDGQQCSLLLETAASYLW